MNNLEMVDIETLKYPIGKYKKPNSFSQEEIDVWIKIIDEFPAKLDATVSHLTDAQLDTAYRRAGSTIRQIVHHCADSHINSFVRFKLALTEDQPTIKPYFEDRWAELIDARVMPIAPSIMILKGIHQRWVTMLRHLDQNQLSLIFIHPGHGRKISIQENIALYAWHCKHHLAHITVTIRANQWID